MPTDSVSLTLNELQPVVDAIPHVPQARGEDDPLMPFETELRLTRDQESKLIDFAVQRLTDVENDVGRVAGGLDEGDTVGAAVAAARAEGTEIGQFPWMTKRQLFYRHFYHDYQDRVQPDTVYAHSNLHASLSTRIAMQVAGKLKGSIFGSDPWLSALPVGPSDADLAMTATAFIRHKGEEAKLRTAQENAIDLACVLGEAVVKTTHVEDAMWWPKTGEIAVIAATGQPAYATDGSYVFRDEASDQEMVEVQTDPTVEPQLQPTGRFVLRRDNRFVFDPAVHAWKRDRVKVKHTKYRGARSEPIFFTDFLCPSTAHTVDAADAVFHLYDKQAMDVAGWFIHGRFDYLRPESQTTARQDQAAEALRTLLATASHGGNHSDATVGRTTLGETETPSREGSSGMIQVVEAWLRYDADGDGTAEEICLLFDRQTKLPLYYEYTGLVTDDHRRPFTVHRALPVHGRWYGVGIVEYLDPEQSFIDLLVNRWNMSLGQSGKIVGWRPDQCEEGQTSTEANTHLELQTGKAYRLKPGVTMDEFVQVKDIYATQTAADIRGMIEFYMQLMQLKTGVISVGDESVANLESSKLATGIRSLENSGRELFTSWVKEARDGVLATTEKFATVTLARMDQREVFQIFEGDQPQLGTLAREQVDGVKVQIRLILSQDEDERVLNSVTNAFGTVLPAFYALPPEAQEGARSATVEALRALRIKDADKLVVPLQPPALVAGAEPGADPAAAQVVPDVI